MDDLGLRLLATQRAEFSLSGRLYLLDTLYQAAILLVAAVSIFITNEANLYRLSFTIFILTAIEWVLGHSAREHQTSANQARRSLLIVEGLGYHFEAYSIPDLLAESEFSETELTRWAQDHYFASPTSPGIDRMATLLKENSFFSFHLHRRSGRRHWFAFIVSTALAVAALLFLPISGSPDIQATIPQVVIVLFTSILAAKMLDRAISSSIETQRIRRIYDRIRSSSKITTADLMALLGDYDAAVQQLQPIPSRIYESNRRRLTKLFEAEGSGKGGSKTDMDNGKED